MTPLWPTDRFLDRETVSDQRALWLKWYISTRNKFCGYSWFSDSGPLPSVANGRAFKMVHIFIQDGPGLINWSEEVCSKTNYLGFSNNEGFVCMHLTVAKAIHLNKGKHGQMAPTAHFSPFNKPFVKQDRIICSVCQRSQWWRSRSNLQHLFMTEVCRWRPCV